MLAKALVLLIRIYQRTLSPLLGNVCRFEPSCSRYAVACLESHGALRGSYLTMRRLLRCHPFHPGGYDPPPLGPGERAEDRPDPAVLLAQALEAPAPAAPPDDAGIGAESDKDACSYGESGRAVLKGTTSF